MTFPGVGNGFTRIGAITACITSNAIHVLRMHEIGSNC